LEKNIFGDLTLGLVSAESPARNVPECKAEHAQTASLAASRKKTSFAKSATAPTAKALNSALNAKIFPVKSPSWDQ
jgi:hypothetical protein